MKRKNLFKVLALAMAMAQPVDLFAQETVGGGTDAASVASPYGKSASRTQHDADLRGPSSAKAANARHKAPGDVVSYGISFSEDNSGRAVTSENYTDISAANGFSAIKSGTVTFDPATYTLTLKNAVITAPVRYDKEKSNIETSLFTLRLEGQNEITSRGASVAIANGDAVIEGPGSLKTSSEKDCGLYVRGNHTFEIRNTGQMELEGRWGISGPSNIEGNLKITNANVRAKGWEGSICDLSSIELTDCKITSPAGAVIDGGAVKLNGNVCTEEVVIARVGKKYGIRIGDVEVTEDNYQDISAAGGFPAVKSGEVIYSPITNDMLLRDAVVERTIIYTGTEKFIIYLRGKNSISDESNDALILKAATTIMDSGSLKCSGAGSGIYLDGNHILEISNDGGIEAEGKWGIAGRDGSVGTLKLKLTNARVKAKGRVGSICDFKTITLEGCEIDAPAGAVIEGGAVKLNGNVCTEEVVIAPFEKKYGIRIGGVEVTTKNYFDISAAGGFPAVKSGKVTYDPQDNRLWMEDAVVEGMVYYHGTDRLTIHPVGENSVSDASQAAIHLLADALIYGPGSLKCSAPYDCGIYLHGQHTLRIMNQGGIEAEGQWGIAGNNRAEGRLRINWARVKARGTRGSICDFEAITLEDCRMQEPAGAVIDGGSVKLGGSVCTEEVVIVPFVRYGIWIGSKQLTDGNYQDISPTGGFPGVKSGKVTYEPETNTLTLKDAVVEGFISCGSSEKIYIDLEGENSVSTKDDMSALYIDNDATIKGTGSLKCSAKKASGLFLDGDFTLEIRNNGGIEAEGKYGIRGNVNAEINLKLINAQVKARGTDGSICNFKTITLEGCEIVSPTGAVIEGGNVMLNGNVCTEEVVIAPAEKKYGIRIGGVEVTKANYQDISAAGGFPAVKSGKVTYNPDTGTLTLTDGTSVEANGTHGIQFYNQEATHALELKGESKVTTTGAWMCALSTSGSLLVNGGKCLFQATEECAMEARDGGRLEITNCDIEALGGKFGLCGDMHKETLLVSRSNIRAQGSQFSLAYFKEISLTDCQLTEPTGAVIEGGDVKLGGEITNQTVVIMSSGYNAIRDIASEGKRPAGAIYSLSGVRMSTNWESLPRGIYIVDGKKMIKD
ncbi:MAG: hypothetical protein ILA39_05180 [Bacteroidaceae bacterium]|nr:hypothetical protein [Bacteroidaceae bacterium]